MKGGRMKKIFIYLIIGIVLIGVGTAISFGNIIKNPDDTYTETKQITIVQHYPSILQIDEGISACQFELDKQEALQELFDKSTDETEKKALWDAITQTIGCTNEQLTYLQDLKNELSKVK